MIALEDRKVVRSLLDKRAARSSPVTMGICTINCMAKDPGSGIDCSAAACYRNMITPTTPEEVE